MELQRLNQNKETDKRKRSIALKASSSMQEEEEEESDVEKDFSLFVKKWELPWVAIPYLNNLKLY